MGVCVDCAYFLKSLDFDVRRTTHATRVTTNPSDWLDVVRCKYETTVLKFSLIFYHHCAEKTSVVSAIVSGNASEINVQDIFCAPSRETEKGNLCTHSYLLPSENRFMQYNVSVTWSPKRIQKVGGDCFVEWWSAAGCALTVTHIV